MKKASLTILLVINLALSAITVLNAKAQEEPTTLKLSMPKEYINYTITNKNGSHWAKIQGKYPIKILNSNKPQINLPMVYPTPPNTTNIQITLNGQELNYNNYTQIYPETLHHTAIGDWTMIQCLLENVTDTFLLEIQYEHPIQQIEGYHTFLYDLNIRPYLSTQSPNSIAYFTINFEIPLSEIKISTTKTKTNWNPLHYTIEIDESKTTIKTQINSNYLEPLTGDLVVSFITAVSEENHSFLRTVLVSTVVLIVVTLWLLCHLLKPDNCCKHYKSYHKVQSVLLSSYQLFLSLR